MDEVIIFLQNCIITSEGIAAITALVMYHRSKENQWKYFAFYLLIIFLCELLGKFGDKIGNFNKPAFFNFFVIPLQFIFFYWLYAKKSLNKPKLFYSISLLYILSFLPSEQFLKSNYVIFSLNYTLGCLILLILIIMEYNKQINSSDIMSFHKNRMFYINLGVTLFYIGTLPLWTFLEILNKYKEISLYYHIYFLISGIVMYLLFSISYLWGKRSS